MSRYSRIDCKCLFTYHIFVNISLYLKNTCKVSAPRVNLWVGSVGRLGEGTAGSFPRTGREG